MLLVSTLIVVGWLWCLLILRKLVNGMLHQVLPHNFVVMVIVVMLLQHTLFYYRFYVIMYSKHEFQYK